MSNGEPQAYLRIYTGSQTGEDAEEQMSTNSLFEFEFDCDSEYGKATVWEEEKKGGNVPSRYRFRHLNSGRVLTVKVIKKDQKDIFVLTTT